MAWLHATPKPDERSRRGREGVATKFSRIERMKRDGIPPVMPPNPAPHLIDRLVEMGVSEAAGMGVVPLSWREINAWCLRTGVNLEPWEARLIRRLSAEYVAEGRRAEAETCPSPFRAPVTAREREIEQVMLEAVLG